MHPPARFSGPFSDLRAASFWPDHLHRHAPAIAWLRKQAHPAQHHTALPSDLFLVTVYCDPGLHCGTADEVGDLEVVVSSLRTRPAQFRSSGGGELAVALLTPLGLLQAFRVPMEGVTDRRVPLAWFCGMREQRALRAALMYAATPNERLRALATWLERRIADTPDIAGPERRVAQAAMALYESDGEPPSVEEIARTLSIGRRQLERDFRRWLGLSPGLYNRLVRFQRAASAVIAGRDLMHVAAEQGYADQPHMTRAFRELAQATPGEIAACGRHPGAALLRSAFAGRMLMLQPPAGVPEIPAWDRDPQPLMAEAA